jgi:hypothetical protein
MIWAENNFLLLTRSIHEYGTKLKRFVQVKKKAFVTILAEGIIEGEVGARNFVEQYA